MGGFVTRLPTSASQFLTRVYFKYQVWKKFGSFAGIHSVTGEAKEFNNSKMKIKILPALTDNYMYLIIDDKTKKAAIVDPVEPEKVLEAVAKEDVRLTTILTTHHHWDHSGGNKKLSELVKGLSVIGCDDRIDALTKKVNHKDLLQLGELEIECLFTPCHTKGHICYYVKGNDSSSPSVFTGDTLFLAGCGKFFEGNAQQMYEALIDVLSKLPDDTKVFCGHEYSQSNLRFALSVEPDNEEIKKKLDWCVERRSAKPPLTTIPSTIDEEKKYNPFMRVNEPTVRSYTRAKDGIDCMDKLRTMKNNF